METAWTSEDQARWQEEYHTPGFMGSPYSEADFDQDPTLWAVWGGVQ